MEELVSLSAREQDPAKQKEIADILARLEPINDKIDIPAGTLVPTDPTDPQISQGMDTLGRRRCLILLAGQKWKGNFG